MSARLFFVAQPAFILAGACCLTPWVSPPVALGLGVLLANTTGNPFRQATPALTKKLLQLSIVGLGFGMNAQAAVQASSTGFTLTVASICFTLLVGFVLGKWLKVENTTAYLVAVGTAICGGSAIAAVSPLVQAQEKQMSLSLGIVFLLNSVALVVFPWLGHRLHLSQAQFGVWAALAIHDTSSVVGAGQSYGEAALQLATTVKMARALWIIPVAVLTAWRFQPAGGGKITVPYFIGAFVLAMLLNTYAPASFTPAFTFIAALAKRTLTLTLFLAGSGLVWSALKTLGIRPLLMGLLLWLLLGTGSLFAILQ
ncbi:YeiH family protein [Rufibacter ruber]|uniref:YeiH family protein n=1 Tax=Rufibacter ruber TaxID=1783499 RepID=UPI00082AD05B|nr:putative sulfate exporter family transporter [Rufibacter ruber]